MSDAADVLALGLAHVSSGRRREVTTSRVQTGGAVNQDWSCRAKSLLMYAAGQMPMVRETPQSWCLALSAFSIGRDARDHGDEPVFADWL